MTFMRTFIILLLMLTMPVSGMAAVISASNCQRMNSGSTGSGMITSHTMVHGAQAAQKMDHRAAMGHAGMQHGSTGHAADGKNSTSDCPCSSDCACSGAIALMRIGTGITPNSTQNIIAVKPQHLFSIPFTIPYRPPTFPS